MLGWIKRWFPDFELTWLASEMRENIPKEIDFRYEAHNAQQAEEDFRDIRTSLYIRMSLPFTRPRAVVGFINSTI